ncbi:MAG: cytochrome b/b6 domain-containing protein [Aestuariivirga sp.]
MYEPDAQKSGAMLRVWDIFVRLFHWSLVAGMAAAWFTSSIRSETHQWIGLAVAALVIARIVWGFVGKGNARFAGFIKGPITVTRYLVDIVRGSERRYIGHNPAGGAMIVALLLCILATAFTGWLMTTDAYYGDDTMQFTHSAFAYAVVGLIILHIAGVALASFRHRENLPRAMITGLKRGPAGDDAV